MKVKEQKMQHGKILQAAYWKQWAGRKHTNEKEESMQVWWRKEQEIGRRLGEGGVCVGGGAVLVITEHD